MKLFRVVAWCCVGASIATGQVTYEVDVTGVASGTTLYWSDETTFTPNGTPGPLDTVVYATMLPWSGKVDLSIVGADCEMLVVSNSFGANAHTIYFTGVNTFHAIKSYCETPVFGNHWNHRFNYQYTPYSVLVLSEYHELGQYRREVGMSGGQPCMVFTNDAKITYHTSSHTNAAGAVDMPLAVRHDFRFADSVYLARNPNRLTLDSEYIYDGWSGVVTVFDDLSPFVIGRADGETQIWTVEPGSHPVLLIHPSQSGGLLRKVGEGDVLMPNVDMFVRANYQCGISSTGRSGVGGAMRNGGMISVNSLCWENWMGGLSTHSLLEHIVVNGQSGLDCDGEGSGYSVGVATGDGNMRFAIQTGWNNSAFNVGRLEATPTAFPMRFWSNGDGWLALMIGNIGQGVYFTDETVLIANTLELASPSVYVTDRCLWYDIDMWANSIIELRGDFVNQSTNNVDFRMDSTTVRYVGGGTNELAWIEVAGEDRGEDDPGIDNFAWRDLVLGQDSTNGLWTVNVALRDDYRNFTESGEPEALYVKNLELYSNSILYLEGQKLYTMVGGVWQLVRTGAWSFGDGTGTICNFHTHTGTLILVR